MTSMNEDQQKELSALVAWLQTFPEFGLTLFDCNDNPVDAQGLHNSLSTIEAVRAVSKVAESICGPGEYNETDGSSEQIWTSLLIKTSTLARPLPKEPRKEGNDNRITPARLKLFVLGNLLDCAVQTQDLQKRRVYIERIMGLKKMVQKTLMALIERRGPKRPASSSATHPSNGTSASIAESATHAFSINGHNPTSTERTVSKSASQHNTNKNPSLETSTLRQQEEIQRRRASVMSPPPARSASKMSESNQHIQQGNNSLAVSHVNSSKGKASETRNWEKRSAEEEDVHTNASSATECRSNTSKSRNKQILKQKDKTSQNYTSSFLTSSFTPEQKSSFNGRSLLDNDNNCNFLSPGIVDSPNQLTEVINDLKLKNDEFTLLIDGYKRREEEQTKKMGDIEAEYRKEMMKVESKLIDRNQEMKEKFEEEIKSLKKELENARTKAREGVSALHELKLARDELELLSHEKDVLADTTEKLKKYKDKVGELHDVKQSLECEREANAIATEKIVRMENELESAKPLRRQVEEYKFRAIEAELKLVECQSYLRRMEQLSNDQSDANQCLWNGVMLQKEQLEEMQRRIQQETETIQREASECRGVGDGVSELNPELNQELIRLRGENLQLRAFAAKREADAVQRLEESLDDTKRLVNRYKEEFLATKKSLNETKAMLGDSRSLETKLKKDIQGLQQQSELAEKQNGELTHQLTKIQMELETCKQALIKSNEENAILKNDLNGWRKKTHDIEIISNERMERLKNVLSDLEETTSKLRSTERMVQEQRDEITNRDTQASKNSVQIQQLKRHIQQVSEEISETQSRFHDAEERCQSLVSQVGKLTTEKANLQEQLRTERKLRQEETEESQQALEATRQVLEAKYKKEIEELQSNMNCLLDGERRAVRQKEEDSKRKQEKLQQEWQAKYEELEKKASAQLVSAQTAAREMEDCLKTELQEQLSKERKESSETHDKIIRKGKAMLEESKKKARDEIQRLDIAIKHLEDKGARLENEKRELESILQSKISSLKQKLEFSTSQLNSMTQEAEDLQERIKTLEREKFKLLDDNDRFRRQLGGRFGADGKVLSTLENLQKEYNAVLEENRKLKAKETGSFFESFITNYGDSDHSQQFLMINDDNGKQTQSYQRREGMNGSTLTQLRQEYEETIESLNDEKRELIMRHSAAITDVQKAEQRAWEREQEVSKLNEKITSLQLSLQRATFSQDQGKTSSEEISVTPPRNTNSSNAHSLEYHVCESDASLCSRSPGIERALKHKVAQENELRTRFSSLTGISTLGYNRMPSTMPTSGTTISHSGSSYKLQCEQEATVKEESSNECHQSIPNENWSITESTVHSVSSNFHEQHDIKLQGTVSYVGNISKNQEGSDLNLSDVKVTLNSDFTASDAKHDSAQNSAGDRGYLITGVSGCHLDESLDTSNMPDTNESILNKIDTSLLSSSRGASPTSNSDMHYVPNEKTKSSKGQVPGVAAGTKSNNIHDSIKGTGSVTSSNKYEGRFDRWTNNVSIITHRQNDSDTNGARNRWAGMDNGIPQQSGKAMSPPRNQDRVSTTKKDFRRKSANFQKAASVFEAAASKGFSPDKPSSILFKSGSPNKVSSLKKRIEIGKNGNVSESVLSVSKKFEQQANQFHSPNSSAFKMASAVFEVSASMNKVVARSPQLIAKPSAKPVFTQNQTDLQKQKQAYKPVPALPTSERTQLSETRDGSQQGKIPSIVDVTTTNQLTKSFDEDRQDCKQS